MTMTNATANVPTTVTYTIPAQPEAKLLERITALRQTIAPTLTDGELHLFAIVAERKGLDPFSGQIMAVKRKSKYGDRVTYQTGIDGYRSIAERTTQYRGSDEPEFGPACDCKQAPRYHPEYARVTVHRRVGPDDYIHQTARAKWHEYVPSEAFMWGDKPEVMLGKCAEAQALRRAFPWVLGDLYIPEEMARGDEPPAPPVAVTARASVAARAAELRGDPSAASDGPGPDEDPPAAAVPTQPAPDQGGPSAAATVAADPEPLTLTSAEFRTRLLAAGLTPDDAKRASAVAFPDRPAASLTPAEWGALWTAIAPVTIEALP